MKKIYINESQLDIIKNGIDDKEVTFYEFFINTKSFLKDLLNKPSVAEPSDIFKQKGITKDDLISNMKKNGLLISNERIDEVPSSDGSSHKVAKRFITYKIPKENFESKIHLLYKELFNESHDSSNIKIVMEDGSAGAGATNCGGVMQGGGGNPSAGQYEAPMSPVQRRKFWEPAMTRNKDEKNNSISMNRKS